MEKRLLHTVLDYEKDIAPYRFIQIYSGVGSGKNLWVQKLAEAGSHVLLITSRQITADAQAKKLDASRWINLDQLLDADEREFECLYSDIVHNVVCTNSGLEKFVRHHFSVDDTRTHLWNKFDYIILDEAHSLSTDATFADAPFYVEKFLGYAIRHSSSSCRYIFMTGTLAPIKWLLNDYADEVHLADYFEKCEYVVPKKVYLINGRRSKQILVNALRAGRRVVYFANNIKSMTQLISYLKDNGISESDIGVMYADDNDDRHFSDELVKRKAAIYQSLKDEEMLPSDIKLFIATTKCKEGINIMDEDISIMLSENNYYIDLIQMAGRVRKGLNTLYVICDAQQNYDSFSRFDAEVNRECVAGVNEAYSKYIGERRKHGDTVDTAQLIKRVENMFRCIRFNPITQAFEAYEGRINGILDYCSSINDFACYADSWDEPVNGYGEFGCELIKRWFPHSEICIINKRPSQGEVKDTILSYLKQHDYMNRALSKEEQSNIKDYINREFGIYGNRVAGMSIPVKSLAPALGHLNISCRKTGRNSEGKRIIEYIPPDDGIKIEL